MISEKENVRISKMLSLVLRHQPGTIGITLDENGWTDVASLLQQLSLHKMNVSSEILEHVVNTNSKKRFSFNGDKTKIRASQGHSVDIELSYEATKPPQVLYHGTAESSVSSILQTGLDKRSRHHVHLSENIDTARQVGQRYGKPVILVIAADKMYEAGYLFYVSDNKVWLTDHVPVQFIMLS